MSSRDKIRIGRERAENTETNCSPITFAASANSSNGTTPSLPDGCRPDAPVISNVRITSAAAPAAASATTTTAAASTLRNVQTLTFDIANVSPAIANMLRRVFTTEVPTVAFDKILIEENDGVVLDELLSHRLGLCPVSAPVKQMEYITESTQCGFQRLDPTRCVVFDLDVTGNPSMQLTNVYSSMLTWVPLPGQESWTSEDVFLVHQNILLAKLGPNQRIKLRAVATKGLGLSHSKWSPVAACFYEMTNQITFSSPVEGDAAEKLRKACPMRVFDVEDGIAVARRPRDCTVCRECIRVDRYPEFGDKVQLQKKKSEMHFTIESLGQHSVETIFTMGMQLFADRMRHLAKTVRGSEVKVATKGTFA